MTDTEDSTGLLLKDCINCDEEFHEQCPQSKRECGHHCNHVWTHDECCWCGKEFGPDDEDNDTKGSAP